MADNLSQKSSKSNEKTKYSNAINRTTSETMRLGEPEKAVNHPTTLISSTPNQRKKTPSFQITSVTVGSRASNDGGEDSADDLDESHTDDMSDVVDNSRITDIENETPSYSEDTFSKEDVFFNASSTSLGSAPVIPTSSQYGLAIVASESGSNIINAAVACANTITGGDVHVSVTDTGSVINIVSSVKPLETEMRDVHAPHAGRNERFKVVKIESTEPFKRGRWLCMDYLDHTMLQQQSQQPVINVVRSTESSDTTAVGSVQYTGPDSGVVLTDGLSSLQSMDDQIILDQPHMKSSSVSLQDQQHQAMMAAQQQASVTVLTTGQNSGPQNSTGSNSYTSVSPGQTLQQVQQPVSTGSVQPSQQHMNVSSSQSHQGLLQQIPVQQQPMQSNNIPQSLPQNVHQVVNQQQMQSQQQNQQTNTQQNLQPHAQSMSQVSVQQGMAAGIPQQPQPVSQHQSLPPQQIQQVMAAANLQQIQQQQQQQQIQQQNMSQGTQPPQQQSFPSHQNQLQQPPTQPSSVSQNAGQQQASSQSVSQGMVSVQQPQSQQQHITSQPGQSQGQFYSIPSSTGSQQVGNVPISQGQSSIQIVPQQTQTSISAQTQTIQSSTQSQISGVATSQSQQAQTATAVPLQSVTHQIQQVSSQSQPMQQIGQSASSQQLQSQTSQVNIPQQQFSQQQLQPQSSSQNIQQQTVQSSQQVIQQPQQSISQQSMQQPQQTVSQQSMQQPQQTVSQQTIQQPQQTVSQQTIQQPQQVIQQPQQTVLQPQQPVTQQTLHQPQQTIPQVLQQTQQSIPQQVMQQQQPQQQQQVISQPSQTVQQMNHSSTVQNIQQQQQIHVQNLAQQAQSQPTLTNMVQGQGIITSQSQSMIPGHQMSMTGGQPVTPHMVPAVSSSISASAIAPSYSHIPMSQTSIQTFPTTGVTAVSSQTMSGCAGTNTVNIGMEGTVDQATGVSAANVIAGDPSVALLESLVEVTASSDELQPGSVTSGEDAESASGTSAVAIDNKIEQAMDLVKSHLMFAVREEVEVLKEKIAELMDRINQLEFENTILKANASQETLAQLGGNNSQQGNKNQQSLPPPNGSVS